MLIKVTNKCSHGCSHCMENSTVAGEHMTRDTFEQSLALTDELEEQAYALGIPPLLLLSGGEATEHPDVLWFIGEALSHATFGDPRGMVILITNGMWLDNPELRAAILRPEWSRLMVQVTNDPRFYPTRPKSPMPDDPRVHLVPTLSVLVPLGRLKPERARAQLANADGLPIRKGPPSFNFRSLTRSTGDVRAAIAILRARAVSGMAGHCTPSISQDGTLVAGETNSCFAIGRYGSTATEITRAVLDMQCNRCGLETQLTHEQKLAIGARAQ